MSPGCLFSSSPCPCEPCVWCLSGLGSCHPPFSASHWYPSCGTCGGGMSPIHCGMVKAEMLKGHSSPGSWWQPPCHPFWGLPWKNPCGCCHLCHCLVCVRDSGGLPGGEPKAYLFVGVQHQRRDECLFQASSTSIACIVVCHYYVVHVGEVIHPYISTEGTEGELY